MSAHTSPTPEASRKVAAVLRRTAARDLALAERLDPTDRAEHVSQMQCFTDAPHAPHLWTWYYEPPVRTVACNGVPDA